MWNTHKYRKRKNLPPFSYGLRIEAFWNTWGIEMDDEASIRAIREYDGNYLDLDKDRLVLYTVDFLQSRNIEPTFDKIVVAVFKLFPKKFALIGFSEYPDGRTIYYCVFNHCTITRKWLSGNVQSGFRITDRGKYFLEETKKILEGKIRLTRKYSTVPKRKEVTFLNLLKKTAAYKKFSEGRHEDIADFEILEALKLQPNSASLKIKRIEKYLEYAIRIDDKNAVSFLKFLQGKEKSA